MGAGTADEEEGATDPLSPSASGALGISTSHAHHRDDLRPITPTSAAVMAREAKERRRASQSSVRSGVHKG